MTKRRSLVGRIIILLLRRNASDVAIHLRRNTLKIALLRMQNAASVGFQATLPNGAVKLENFQGETRIYSTPQKEDYVAKKNLHAVQAAQENSHPFMEYYDEDGNFRV